MLVLKSFVAFSLGETNDVVMAPPYQDAEQLMIDYDHTPHGYTRYGMRSIG